jgi:LacI family transcriptional regulator
MSLLRIATTLGLSVTTVSRALGGYDDVAAGTRAKVLAEADRIDYQPSRIARQFRTGRSGAIGVVLPAEPGQFSDPFFLQMLSVIGPRLATASLDLLVTSARPGEDELHAHRKMVENRRVDGVLLARTSCDDARISYLLDARIPFVAHGRSDEPRPYAWVDIDGVAASRMATNRLIGLGHCGIGMINASSRYMFARHRCHGWRSALAEAGLPDGPIEHMEPTEENGFRAAQRMLALPNAPSAILCGTDRLAVGCLHALSDAGLRAGRDVAVIGYDDLPISSYTDPPLTTVAQPTAQAARHMVDMLLEQLAGASAADQQVLLTATLVVRASDLPPNDPETRRGTARRALHDKIHPGGLHASPDSQPNDPILQ